MKNSARKVKLERKKNRWLLVFYDTLIYIVCWLGILGMFRQIQKPAFIYMSLGYALFIGTRLIISVYKSILRSRTMTVFARLIFADAIASALLLSVNLVFKLVNSAYSISFLTMSSILMLFAIVSISARLLYCYLYRYAMGKTKFSRMVRILLERIAFIDFDSNVSGATLHWVLTSQETMPTFINELQWVVDKFAIRGQVTSITQMNSGYINRTYRVETLSDAGHVHKYTLQRINTNVFTNPEALMENYKLVTEKLYGTLHVDEHQEKGAVQTLRSTKDGRSYLKDASGCWRMMSYFDDVYSLDIPNSLETFERAGYAFGNFIKAMADVDIASINEVIPNFHNTKSRYLDLERSIEAHPDGRVRDVQEEIEFIRARKDKFGLITDALEAGEIPKRICHNDCNLNNILFDKNTNRPVAIIDLDTVMPSSPLYDYGDSMRIGTNTAKDDEKDLSKVSCDLNMYKYYAKGYLRACGDVLTKRELELLPYSSLIITAEDGIRFLKDHIDGDIYYNICYPNQNLDRARTQLKLVEDMERKLPQIKQILREIYSEMGLDADI